MVALRNITMILEMKTDHINQEAILLIGITDIANNIDIMRIEDVHTCSREKEKDLRERRLNCVKMII